MAHLTSDLVEFIVGWLPGPPSRLLEVGCGDGALTRRLAERGYDVLGLDPEAPDDAGFTRSTLEELRRPGEFDAAIAVRSLHHLHDADCALDNLRDAITPGGRLVVSEFSIRNVDSTTVRWLETRGMPHPVTETDHDDVIPLDRLRSQLERRFHPLFAEPVAYLAREAHREDLVVAEEEAIRAGEIKPAGMRLVFERV